MKIIACDIGGTEIKCALFFNESILNQTKRPTEQSLGKDSIMKTLHKCINDLWVDDIDRIGIVSAGAIDIETGKIVSNSGTLSGWKDFSIKDEIEHYFNVSTFVDNDANGALIGEINEYLQNGVENAVMITLGTGVGTSAIINKETHRGSNFQVEFGHSILIPGGRKCSCGNLGCAESYLSGTALTILAQEKVDSNITHGSKLFDEIRNGNTKAIEVLDEYTELLAIFIQNICHFYDPEIIIIGGGVIKEHIFLFNSLEEKIKKYKVNARIIPAKYGNFAGILGAKLIAEKG